MVEGTDCGLGSRRLGRKDSGLFGPGSAQRRLQVAVAAIERHEGKAVATLLREAQDMVWRWQTILPNLTPQIHPFGTQSIVGL